MALRISAIVIIQIFTVSSVAIGFNRSGEYYVSWSDLLGIQDQYSKIALAPAAVSRMTPADIRSAKSTRGGSLIFHKIIRGGVSGIANQVFVVMPSNLAKEFINSNSGNVRTDYQVVELFSGYPGYPATWIKGLGFVQELEKLEKANKIKPTIAIVPAINVIAGQDTECLNFPGGPQVESWLTTDMQSFAKSFIGIDFRKWGTFGYSTGGWCAAEIAVQNQDTYTGAVSLAGYFSPIFARGVTHQQQVFLRGEYDLVNKIQSGAINTRLFAIASTKDRFSFWSTQNFIRAVRPAINITYDEIKNGGHNLGAWKPYLSPGFIWLSSISSL